MKVAKKLTLRNRLALYLALAALVPALFIAAGAWFINRTVVSKHGLRMEALAQEGAYTVETELEEAHRRLNALARLIDMPKDADANRPTPQLEAVSRQLSDYSQWEEMFSLLVVTDGARRIYATETPGEGRIGRLQHFQLPKSLILKDIPAFSPIVTYPASSPDAAPTTGFWVHTYLPPREGERLATYYLSGFYQLDRLARLVSNLRIENEEQDDSRYYQVIDEQTRDIVLDGREPYGGNLVDRTIGREETVDFTEIGQDSGTPEGGMEVVAASRSPRLVLERAPEEIEGFKIAEKGIDYLSLITRTVVDEDIVDRSQEGYGGMLLGLIGVCLLGLAIFSLPTAYRLLRPMYRIFEGAKKWQSGDLNHFFRGKETEDEWAELMESLNAITARMQAMSFRPPDNDPLRDLDRYAKEHATPLGVELSELKALLRAAVSGDAEGVLVVEDGGRILLHNQRISELWHLSVKGDAPRVGFAFLRSIVRQLEDPAPAVVAIRKLAQNPGSKRNGEVELSDGRVLHFSTRVFRRNEEAAGRIWRFRDVTEQTVALQESERRRGMLDSIIHGLPMALFVKDVRHEFRIVVWNSACEEVLGVPAGHALGRHAYEIFPTRQAEVLSEDDLEAVQRGGFSEQTDLTFETQDRGTIMLRTMKVPLYDRRGNATHLICLAEDITVRRRHEQNVRREQSLLRGLVDSLPNMISLKTRHGAYLGCNKAFERFIGMEEKLLLGQTDEALFDGGETQLPPAVDGEVIRNGHARRHQSKVQLPDGREVELNTVETPLRGPAGEIWGVIGISQAVQNGQAPSPHPASSPHHGAGNGNGQGGNAPAATLPSQDPGTS